MLPIKMSNEIQLIDTDLSGLKLIKSKTVKDNRGKFVKLFQKNIFSKFGIENEFVENYYSLSSKNVIRGMHFQVPPKDHAKLVYVSYGIINDVVVDIRKNSPTFGKYFNTKLSGDNGISIYIPSGFAHGFLVKSDIAIVNYLQTTEYSPKHDHGILWNSISFDWEVENPEISERDRSFNTLEEYMNGKQYFFYRK